MSALSEYSIKSNSLRGLLEDVVVTGLRGTSLLYKTSLISAATVKADADGSRQKPKGSEREANASWAIETTCVCV